MEGCEGVVRTEREGAWAAGGGAGVSDGQGAVRTGWRGQAEGSGEWRDQARG